VALVLQSLLMAAGLFVALMVAAHTLLPEIRADFDSGAAAPQSRQVN
jgi:hypothetical protein